MPKNLASTLHLLLCKKSHNDGECGWYSEEQNAERWKQPIHSSWLKKAEKILQLSGKSEEDFETIFGLLIPLVAQISSLKERNPAIAELIDTILIEASSKSLTPSKEQPLE